MAGLRMRSQPREGSRDGFTLVEVLVAILVLALAAAVVVGVVLPAGAGARSRVDRAHAERAGASLVERMLAEDFALVPAGSFGPNPVPGLAGADATIAVQDLTPRLKQLSVTVRVHDETATVMCLKGNYLP